MKPELATTIGVRVRVDVAIAICAEGVEWHLFSGDLDDAVYMSEQLMADCKGVGEGILK